MITLIQQTIALGNLRRAWNAIAGNDGIAGVDNVSLAVWRRNWEARLRQAQYQRNGDNAFCVALSRAIVVGKIQNQCTLALRLV